MQIADVKKYPKSYKKFLDYNRKYLIALTNIAESVAADVESNFSDLLTDSSVEIAAEGLLTYYPRALYDFFDENKIYLMVMRDDFNFWYGVVEKEGKGKEWGNHKSRISAEEAGFEGSFGILEEQL